MESLFKPVVEGHHSRAQRIVAQLRRLMIEGKLKPGDRLPPERDLARQLNVSRTALREAVKILSAMGLLSIQQGRGVFVTEANMEALVGSVMDAMVIKEQEIFDLFELRKVLETQAVRWAAERASDQELEDIVRMTQEAEEKVVLNEVDQEFAGSHNLTFHLAIARAAKNSVLERTMEGFFDIFRELRTKTAAIPGRQALSVREHRQIAEALMVRDAERAAALILRHIEGVEAAMRATKGTKP